MSQRREPRRNHYVLVDRTGAELDRDGDYGELLARWRGRSGEHRVQERTPDGLVLATSIPSE